MLRCHLPKKTPKLIIISDIKPMVHPVRDLNQTKQISYIQQPDRLKHRSEISATTGFTLLCSDIFYWCLEAIVMIMINGTTVQHSS